MQVGHQMKREGCRLQPFLKGSLRSDPKDNDWSACRPQNYKKIESKKYKMECLDENNRPNACVFHLYSLTLPSRNVFYNENDDKK